MEKKGIVRLGLFGLACAFLLASFTPAAKEAPSPDKKETSRFLSRRGKRLYERRCVFCHGSHGEGNGPVARGIFPKPRNFVRGIFKIRSTPSGSPPTDQDLFDTITRGMPGTMMPSFSNLTEEQRWTLVSYVKSFFTEPGAPSPQPILIPEEETIPTADSVARGRNLYLMAECWKCHGFWGRGDGPSADKMVDDWGFPIRVADLSKPKLLRGGHTSRELYRTISAGVGGTPMPSWGPSLTPDEIWDIVHYLHSRMSE